MSTIPGDNAACCTIPPVQCSYKPKGAFETINGIPTYVVGDMTCKHAIVVVMDIFGMVPLTQQGCDVLSNQGFYVLMPDYLGDQALQEGDIPFDTPEKIEKRNKLFSGVGNPQARAADLIKLGEKLQSDGFTVGSLGFCWGSKVVILAGASSSIAAVAAVHPAILAPKDAEICKAALGFYPTRDEDPAEVRRHLSFISHQVPNSNLTAVIPDGTICQDRKGLQVIFRCSSRATPILRQTGIQIVHKLLVSSRTGPERVRNGF
ncbi:dienelactone hydrolase family protein [Rhizoctonia solani AG-3 Rhs1AP]|uniref:Dienelactone hydrolase family protein n=2 Tax=Rhizoctonia solani AG-3 TaxID=1086053 RepID=A0A074RQ42_9AGAM|nr:dienelactone hydrolase family protein [Rhizoctonia solani AG-3 Rhs1AP]KEP46768.1 dienelactone hydrolase family protein [Rhizoctonia solani 123E]